jgi:hypothetical protein
MIGTHAVGCPEDKDPLVLYTCIECGADICNGDVYYYIDGKVYCEDCIKACKYDAEIEM